MSHWAELDENNIVIRVVVGNNNDTNEGYDWIIKNLGGRWVQTSYNTSKGIHKLGETPLRKNYAGKGYKYDEILDAFISPKPYDSWVLNEDICEWGAPKELPDDGKLYIWDEDKLDWINVYA